MELTLDFDSLSSAVEEIRLDQGNEVPIEEVAGVVESLMRTIEGDITSADLRLHRELGELVDYIRMHLLALDEDPQLTAKLMGMETGKCCFCNKALGNPISVANGYSQICAHNFGLSYDTAPSVGALQAKLGEAQQLKLSLTTTPKGYTS